MAYIYPSLIASNVLCLQETINVLDEHCAGYHIDIMDYHFVPNLTWGPMVANAVRRTSSRRVWIDLLVEGPEQYIADLALAPDDMITFHLESRHDPNIVSHIRNHGYQAGVGINPDTDIHKLEPYISDIDHILIMSVHPGFSGQDFIPASIDRLTQIAEWKRQNGYHFTIGMDGGIDERYIQEIVDNDADHLSIGSGIFAAEDPRERLKHLKQYT